MTGEEKTLRRTFSVCPVCGARVAAEYVRVGEEVYLRKNCREHGSFSAITWRGSPDFEEWIDGSDEISESALGGCPEACGLCAAHRQETCCILLEVTGRCNLHCGFCFAESPNVKPEPTLDELKVIFARLVRDGRLFLQLSGGEPTVRDDLPKIVRLAKQAGFQYIQVNSNGVRLAEDEKFVRALALAGLSFVFMQFDGTDENVYMQLRGRPLFDVKKRAIENCAKHGIGVILVPMLVPGINTHELWNIIKFGIDRSPAVRGVHFQPVSYFGCRKEPPADLARFTLPELLRGIEEQSRGAVKVENFTPSRCDHALCGFHGGFTVNGGEIKPASVNKDEKKCCCGAVSAESNRNYIGTRWLPPGEEKVCCCGAPVEEADSQSFDAFLLDMRRRSFTITAMDFQDIWNLDLDRLSQCSLHVYNDGRIVPFCANYLGLGHAAE